MDPKPGRRRTLGAPAISIGTTWAAVAVALPVIVAFIGRTMAIDLAYQVRAGELMLDSHRLLDVDPFTFTVGGSHWVNQQWGAEVLLGAIYRAGGWGGLALSRGLLLGSVLTFLYLACRGAGAAPRTAALLSLAGWVVGYLFFSQLRPQLFAFVLFAICSWAVATRRSHPRRIWLVPALVVPWVNIHGSFPLATVLLVLAWLEDRRTDRARAKTLVIAIALSLVASFVDPFGPSVWRYVVDLATNPVVSGRIGEWAPPTVRSTTGSLFLASVLAVGVLLARRGRQTDWIPLLTLGVFAVLGLVAGRNVAWWAMLAPVTVAGVIRDAGRKPPETRSSMNLVIPVLLGVVAVVTAPISRGTDPVSGGPATLTFAPEYLVATARGAVPAGSHAFVSEVYASWSEFSAPDLPVAVDPRIELFPVEVWNDYTVVTQGRSGWQGVLDRWHVQVLILHPAEAAGLIRSIRDDPTWRPIDRSVTGSVYVRASS
jgi:hypothetical protein